MSFGFAHGAIQWLSTDAANTTYTVSGLSFAPKAIRFYWQGLQSATDAVSESVSERLGFGFAVSTSSRCCTAVLDTDASGSMACARGNHNAAVAATVASGGTFDGLLDITSFDSGGFVLTVDDAAPVSLTVFWEAWGGTDITVAVIGTIAEPASNTTVDSTVTGFTSTGTDQVVFFTGTRDPGTTLPTSSAESSGIYCGFASSGNADNNIVLTGLNDHGSASADSWNYALSGLCIANLDNATPSTVREHAVVTQWNTDGFRTNWILRNSTGRLHFFMAIKGGQWAVGEYTIAGNSANATATVNTLSFQPVGISLITGGKVESTDGTPTQQQHICIGTGTSTSSRRSMGMLSEDGNTDAQINTTIQYDQVLSVCGATGNLAAAYDISSIDANGFTIIVDVAGGVANEWHGYLAFAGAAAGTTTLTASKGTLSLTGATAVNKFTQAADKGTVTLTGKDASLRLRTNLSAQKGILELSGDDHITLFKGILGAAKGTLALTGKDATFRQVILLTASKGTLTLTGDTSLFTEKLAAAKAALTLTGNTAAIFRQTFRMAASLGLLTLSGGSATNKEILAAQKGSLTLTGKAALSTITVVSAKGTLTLTGKDATFREIVITRLTADKGVLTLTGRDALFIEQLAATKGTLVVNGKDVALIEKLLAAKAVLTLTGDGAVFIEKLLALGGSLVLTGQVATFSGGGPETVTLTADKGLLLLTGAQTTFLERLAAAKGTLVVSGADALFLEKLLAAKGDLTLTGKVAAFVGGGGGPAQEMPLITINLITDLSGVAK